MIERIGHDRPDSDDSAVSGGGTTPIRRRLAALRRSSLGGRLAALRWPKLDWRLAALRSRKLGGRLAALRRSKLGWRRLAVTVLAVLAVVAAGAAVAYRVLAPAEVVNPARAANPAQAVAKPGVLGAFSAAPLIVDGRLRIYATTRQVRADGPLDARTQRSPYWSYRRWPQQLVGVVEMGYLVITRWSDGALVALDAWTGQVTWRADGPIPKDDEYAGRRTGAASVYRPEDLLTAGSMVMAAGEEHVEGYDATTGELRWTSALGGSPRCRSVTFTTADRFGWLDGCASPPILRWNDAVTGAPLSDWRPGPVTGEWGLTPIGCQVGWSACRAARTDGGGIPAAGWLFDGAVQPRPADQGEGEHWPLAAPALAPAGRWLVDDVVVDGPTTGGPPGWLGGPPATRPSLPSDGAGPSPGAEDPGEPDGPPVVEGPAASELSGWSLRTGARLWRWTARSPDLADQARVVAVESGAVHLLTGRRELITLDAETGAELSRFVLVLPESHEKPNWVSGYVYARNRFIAVERVADPEGDGDRRYYFTTQPVIFAGT